jgi:hypothetical protein
LFQILAAYGPVGEQLRERRADLRFVAVSLGGVEVTKAHLYRCLDGMSGLGVIGERSPESKRRNLAGAGVQDESVLIEVVVRCHGCHFRLAGA